MLFSGSILFSSQFLNICQLSFGSWKSIGYQGNFVFEREWCCPLSFHNQDEPVVVLKSLGSWLSFVGVLYFLFIVWEALVSQRGVVCKTQP